MRLWAIWRWMWSYMVTPGWWFNRSRPRNVRQVVRGRRGPRLRLKRRRSGEPSAHGRHEGEHVVRVRRHLVDHGRPAFAPFQGRWARIILEDDATAQVFSRCAD